MLSFIVVFVGTFEVTIQLKRYTWITPQSLYYIWKTEKSPQNNYFIFFRQVQFNQVHFPPFIA